MRRFIVPALLVTALVLPVMTEVQAQQPSSYYTPEERAQWRALPSADDSLHVASADIDALLADGAVVFLDVREPDEIEELGTREGYINIPILELEQRLDELDKDAAILTACNGRSRAARAAAMLLKHGFTAINFCGLRDYEGSKIYPKAQQ